MSLMGTPKGTRNIPEKIKLTSIIILSVSATDKKKQKKKTSKAVEHFLYYSVLFKKRKNWVQCVQKPISVLVSFMGKAVRII